MNISAVSKKIIKGWTVKKKKFYSSLTGKKNSDKVCDHVLKVWDKFGIETMKCT